MNPATLISLWGMISRLNTPLLPANIWLLIAYTYSKALYLNSLAPGRSECDSKNVIFNLVLLISIFRSCHDNALQWMPKNLTDDKSTLIQVMAWCRQATSHYLSQCWLSFLSPYGVTRPQWINTASSYVADKNRGALLLANTGHCCATVYQSHPMWM